MEKSIRMELGYTFQRFSTLKNLFALLGLCAFFAFQVACQKPSSSILLTEAEANHRFKLIKNVKYKLSLDLTKEDFFEGEEKIIFDLIDLGELRIDFFDGKVSKLIVNEKESEILLFPGYIQIPKSSLQLGKNSIEIRYSSPFSRSGNGLHRFKDPDDGETYLYTQFESFHANKVFPCFDQPNLKSTFTLDAIVPTSWEVVSSTLPKSIDAVENSLFKKVQFSESDIFSTYLFSIHAGPYFSWKDQYKEIPLRLFARKSMARFVKADEWFEFTKQGFEFFEAYFEIPYPFKKYDQLIVPEFNFGAMENVAAVTFSERFVSRGSMTLGQRENISNVILHEMAHMWFGNLVTMDWWDGLWLNESFATFMATLAQSKNTEFKDSWESFSERMKEWAYEEDSYSTNHPIQGEIRNTEEASTHFDGITYGKGAAVLKQLAFFVGEENFRIGVRDYLKKHSFGNTLLSDFLSSVAGVSNHNLDLWSNQWLKKKGTNTIALSWNCSANHLDLRVVQGFKKGERTYRNHRTVLKFYGKGKSQLMPIYYSGKHSRLKLDLEFCPEFVFANFEDHDFVTVVWSKEMEESFLSALSIEKDPLTKFMLWDSYFDQVELGRLSINDFYARAKLELNKENTIKLKRWLLTKISSDSSFSYLYTRFWLPESDRNKDILELENYAWSGLQSAEPKSDSQKYWLSALKEVTFSREGQEKLWNLYENPLIVKDLDLDQDQKWAVLIKLSALGFDKDKLTAAFTNETTKDTSIRGKNSALIFEAISPNLDTKQKFFRLLMEPNSKQFSLSTLKSIASQLFPMFQSDLESEFQNSIYSSFRKFDETYDENFVASYTQSMAISRCDKKNTRSLDSFLFWNFNLSPIVRKELMKHRDREKVCTASKEQIGLR